MGHGFQIMVGNTRTHEVTKKFSKRKLKLCEFFRNNILAKDKRIIGLSFHEIMKLTLFIIRFGN